MAYKWRGWARGIGWVQFILSGLAFFHFAHDTIVLIVEPELIMEKVPNEKDAGLVGVALLVLVAITGFLCWGAVELIEATEDNVDPFVALERLNIWFNIHLVIYMIGSTYIILTNNLVGSLIKTGVLVGCTLIVGNYGEELKAAARR